MRALSLLLLIAVTACAQAPAGPVANTDRYQEHRVLVPVAGTQIFTRLCLPPQGATAALVLINHGSPASADRRPAVTPAACGAEAVQWFLARGHAVGLPLRRGYGENGGRWAESYGRCDTPDFRAGGLETARDIEATLEILAARPDVPRGPAIIVGQSAGGWGAMALASRNPPGVQAYVNMAGGRGGWRNGQANNNCSPAALVRAAGEFGATARASMLWVYTANDSFFDPDLAARMHTAFTAAGGQARLLALGPYGRDGHSLFFSGGGAATWGPLVTEFLR